MEDQINPRLEFAGKSETDSPKVGVQLHPILIVLALMLAAAALTYLAPAGKFHRHGAQVIPGTYKLLSKVAGINAVLAPTAPLDTDVPARAAGVVALFTAIPAGMAKSADLFFMVMFVGGAFGVLRATGAIDAGVDRLLHLTSGNVYLVAAGLIVLLSCGSTFLGFSSAYLALIPLVLGVGQRLGLPNLFAPAVVTLADFIGYSASVTNPIALGVTQRLAGVRLFSGIMPRLVVFIIMLAIGLAYVMWFLRRVPRIDHVPNEARLSSRQSGVLLCLVLGGIGLVSGTALWSWGNPQLASAFIALALTLAVAGGLRPVDAANAWLEGMRGMLLPCLLIGLASAIGIILQSSQVLDGIVLGLASLVQGHSHGTVAMALMAVEMAFGVIIPSVSSKAAISMPIMAPIAHLSGVSGQVAVSALLLGSGMTNMITPTNDLLLAFLAASKVNYLEWLRFIAPLFATFCVVSLVSLYLMTALGY